MLPQPKLKWWFTCKCKVSGTEGSEPWTLVTGFSGRHVSHAALFVLFARWFWRAGDGNGPESSDWSFPEVGFNLKHPGLSDQDLDHNYCLKNSSWMWRLPGWFVNHFVPKTELTLVCGLLGTGSDALCLRRAACPESPYETPSEFLSGVPGLGSCRMPRFAIALSWNSGGVISLRPSPVECWDWAGSHPPPPVGWPPQGRGCWSPASCPPCGELLLFETSTGFGKDEAHLEQAFFSTGQYWICFSAQHRSKSPT